MDNVVKLISRILPIIPLAICAPMMAQEMPDTCVQLPERTEVCPNLLYKKSPIPVPMTNTEKGQIVCICMTDFADIRLPAKSQSDQVNQQVSLSRLAVKVNLSEQDLLTLIRK